MLQVLWAKGTQYFADLHVWFSTLTRPSYSRFTRAQRLTCCLSLLMSYLAVNAAWYKTSMQEVSYFIPPSSALSHSAPCQVLTSSLLPSIITSDAPPPKSSLPPSFPPPLPLMLPLPSPHFLPPLHHWL